MNRFGGLGSSPAPPRPLSNGPARAVPTTGERARAKDFSSSGGSCRLSPGGRARLSVSAGRAYFLVHAYLVPGRDRFRGMTKTLRTSLRAWAQKPNESFVQNLRLRSQASPYQALARRLRTAGTQ